MIRTLLVETDKLEHCEIAVLCTKLSRHGRVILVRCCCRNDQRKRPISRCRHKTYIPESQTVLLLTQGKKMKMQPYELLSLWLARFTPSASSSHGTHKGKATITVSSPCFPDDDIECNVVPQRQARCAKAHAQKDLDSRRPPRDRRSTCLALSPAYSSYRSFDTSASYQDLAI